MHTLYISQNCKQSSLSSNKDIDTPTVVNSCNVLPSAGLPPIPNCNTLLPPEHGMVECSYGADGEPSFLDVCRYNCDIGFVITGNSTSTCLISGLWDSSPANCTRGIVIGSFHARSPKNYKDPLRF